MNQIVGRSEEQAILASILNSREAEFVAVYGRRRVGKTYLVKSYFSGEQCVFFHITGTRNAKMQDQISDYTRIVESTFYDNQLSLENPKDWKRAFELLTTSIKQRDNKLPVVIFFDELPWLASNRSRFMQALDYYWNRFWSDMPEIKLIVCGSAASWMIENIISERGGLHNRITNKIHLSPFDLRETKLFLEYKGLKYNDQQILEVFMITGGIPFYLKFLKKNKSVAQNIDELCFQGKGILVDEFERLYKSLFRNSDAYEELIRIIASKRRGIERKTLLAQAKLTGDGGRANKRLEALEHAGFIVSFKPFGGGKRSTFYRVIDEYSLFYLRWIEPVFSDIRKLDKTKGYWLEKCQTASWKSWAGYAFEAVCYKHIAQIRKALNINAIAEVGSWQYIPKKGALDNGAQIDLLFDRNDGLITLCEIKYSKEPYKLDKESAKNFLNKEAVFIKQNGIEKSVQFSLITNYTIKETMYSEDLISTTVTLEDLLD